VYCMCMQLTDRPDKVTSNIDETKSVALSIVMLCKVSGEDLKYHRNFRGQSETVCGSNQCCQAVRKFLA